MNEYVKWIEDERNGLLVKTIINGDEFILQYQPIDYVALLNLRQSNINPANFRTELNGLEGYYYFSFEVKPSMQVYFDENYLNYKLQDKLQLFQGNDSVPCAFFHHESTRNFSPYQTFLVAFKRLHTDNQDLVFQFRDQNSNPQVIRMEIKKSSLKKMPRLKIE